MKSSPSEAQRSTPLGIYTIRICFGFVLLLLAKNCTAENKRPARAGLFRPKSIFRMAESRRIAAISYINSVTSP
jgi:hypothetical protein